MNADKLKSRTTLAALALVAGSVLAVYLHTLYYPFQFDDKFYITSNPLVHSLSNFSVPAGTRYLGYLSFAVDYALAGAQPALFRLTNIAVHAANASLVFLLVRALFRAQRTKADDTESTGFCVALTTAVIFAVHPVQTQAVIYITQRFAALAALFYLASMLFYLRWRLSEKPARLLYALSLASALCAQMTKEIAFTLPFAVVLMEAAFFARREDARRTTALALLPFLAMTAVIPLNLFLPEMLGWGNTGSAQVVGRDLLKWQMLDLSLFSPYHYFATELRVVVTYLRLLVLPVRQTLLYDYPHYRSVLSPAPLASLVLLCSLAAGASYLLLRSIKRREPLALTLSFGALFFFISLSVESSVIPIKHVIFEHRLYLPGFGASLAFASAAFMAMERIKSHALHRGRATALVLLLTALPLAIAAYARTNVWRSEVSLWTDNVSKAPSNEHALYNLARALQVAGDRAGAIQYYERVLRLYPAKEKAHHNLASLYHSTGELDKAEIHYKETLRLNPSNHAAAYNLAMIYHERGERGRAIEMYRAAIRALPDYADAHYNLAAAYEESGDYERAAEQYRTVIGLDPESVDARYNLGLVYLRLAERAGRKKSGESASKTLRIRAAKELSAALRLNPEYEPAAKLLRMMEKRP